MRVIAGTRRGRQLKTPRWPGLRPTSDKLRETLFNVWRHVEGARVLDGYAGTGAVGIEALSRGAGVATFVEQDARAAALIRENLRGLGLESQGLVVCGAVAGYDPGSGSCFDFIFLDPPYDVTGLADVLQRVAWWLAADGLLVVEHAARTPPPSVSALHCFRTIRSGDSALSWYAPSAVSRPPEQGTLDG